MAYFTLFDIIVVYFSGEFKGRCAAKKPVYKIKKIRLCQNRNQIGIKILN